MTRSFTRVNTEELMYLLKLFTKSRSTCLSDWIKISCFWGKNIVMSNFFNIRIINFVQIRKYEKLFYTYIYIYRYLYLLIINKIQSFGKYFNVSREQITFWLFQEWNECVIPHWLNYFKCNIIFILSFSKLY